MIEDKVTPTKPTEQLAGGLRVVLLVVWALRPKVSERPQGVRVGVTRDSPIKEGK